MAMSLRPLRIEAHPGIVLEVVVLSGQGSATPSTFSEAVSKQLEQPALKEQFLSTRMDLQGAFAPGIINQELGTTRPPPYEKTESNPPSQRTSGVSSPSRLSGSVHYHHPISTTMPTPLLSTPPLSPSVTSAAAAAATWQTLDEESFTSTLRSGRLSRASQQFIDRVQSIILESSQQLDDYEQTILSGSSARNDFLEKGVVTIQHGLDSIHQELHSVVPTLRAEIAKNTTLQAQILEMQIAAEEMSHRMLEMQRQAIGLQEQTLDRLVTIQNRVSAIMTQTYELHEYPIPRLFIILPKEDITRTESFRNVFAKQFKLYFLCECSNHNQSADQSNKTNSNDCKSGRGGSVGLLKQEIHLARHEGYDLERPNEFFEKYGSYVLTLLQMLKYGTVVAGVVVPPLAQLGIVDGLDIVRQSAGALYQSMEPKVDSAIEYLQNLTDIQNNGSASDNLEALEGADLRQLSSFLKNKDEGGVLGNLYRTVTTEGHVKWVCLDHYRATYGLSAQRELREIVDIYRGRYDEPIGCVTIELVSPIQARQFYSTLATSRCVQELRLTMSWDTTLEDYRNLKDALQQSNVVKLEIIGNMSSGPKTDILNRGRRHDPLLQLMAGGKLKALTIRGLREFFERTAKMPSIIHIRSFDLQSCMITNKDGPQLEKMVLASPMLYELILFVQDIDFISTLLLPLIKRLRRFKTLTLHQATRTSVTLKYDFTAMDEPPFISLVGDGIESTRLALMKQVKSFLVQKYQEPHQIQDLVNNVVKKSPSLQVVEIRCLADHFPSISEWFRCNLQGHKSLQKCVLSDGFNTVVIRDFQNNNGAAPSSEMDLEEISTCKSDIPTQNLDLLFEKHGSDIKVLDLDHSFTYLQASNFLQSVRQAQGSKLRTLTWDITKIWDGRIYRQMWPALQMCSPSVLEWVTVKVNRGYRYVDQPGIITVLDDKVASENLGMILKKKVNRLELRANELNVIISKLQTTSSGPYEQLEELYIRGFEASFGGRSVKWVQSLIQRDISDRIPSTSNFESSPIVPASIPKSTLSPTRTRLLTSLTLFHVELVSYSWEHLILSIDFLTIRHLDFTLSNFSNRELIYLTLRCLHTVQECRAIPLPQDGSLLQLRIDEQLQIEDLKEQETHGLTICLDQTAVTKNAVMVQSGKIEEAKCSWVKLVGP
ncbi:hypothetical protein FBU30_007017 [Linnemannia zychae]|nr:hypothetical protein FBU30_007017 [Linnemannia zychae]